MQNLQFFTLPGSFDPVNPVFSYFVKTESLPGDKNRRCVLTAADYEDGQDLQYLKHAHH